MLFRRQETTTKPQRTETTVIYLPDIWSVMPTAEEYANIRKLYDEALQTKLMPVRKDCASPKKDKNITKKDSAEGESKVLVKFINTNSISVHLKFWVGWTPSFRRTCPILFHAF